MNKILAIIMIMLLVSCGDDAIVHRSGESTETKIVTLVGKNQIFIQGRDGAMSTSQFDDYLTTLMSNGKEFSFVIQPMIGIHNEATEDIVELIKKHGVPERHIAVAKTNA